MILFYRYAMPPTVVLQCDVPKCKEYLYWPLTWQPTVEGMRRFALMCGWTQPKAGTDMCQDHSLEVEERVKNAQPQPS